MRLTEPVCWERMTASRVARLATADADGRPHVIPVSFAVLGDGDRLVTAIDQKPKTTMRLRRLRNIDENSRVSVLVDHYSDEWRELWWVRADGAASIVRVGAIWQEAVDALVAKYAQYRDDPPTGAVIEVRIDAWTGWEY